VVTRAVASGLFKGIVPTTLSRIGGNYESVDRDHCWPGGERPTAAVWASTAGSSSVRKVGCTKTGT